MSAAGRSQSLHLPGVEANPKPGVYRDLIESARRDGAEYGKIWSLFAFQHDVTSHLGRFTQGVLREPASISPGFRELIAAYTSQLNECGFCRESHAETAAVLLGDEALVRAALQDPESAPLEHQEKVMLRFVRKMTQNLPDVDACDIDTLRTSGWDDEAIYFAITTCALFNFYNRWITATGVPAMSSDAHRRQGRALASYGYTRA